MTKKRLILFRQNSMNLIALKRLKSDLSGLIGLKWPKSGLFNSPPKPVKLFSLLINLFFIDDISRNRHDKVSASHSFTENVSFVDFNFFIRYAPENFDSNSTLLKVLGKSYTIGSSIDFQDSKFIIVDFDDFSKGTQSKCY